MQFPVFACPVVVRGTSARLHLAKRTITIGAPARVLWTLASRCDGDTPLSELKKELSVHWQPADVARLLSALAREGALVDADAMALQVLPAIENPSRPRNGIGAGGLARLLGEAAREGASTGAANFRRPPAFELRRLLENRRSARGFSPEPVPLNTIMALLWAAYGMQPRRVNGGTALPAHRTVPSGGALYPLRIHLLNLRTLPALARGIYEVRYRRDGAVGLTRRPGPVDGAQRMFADPEVVRSAQAAVVLSGRFARTARKYGNRSLLYVPLEAGHAAQNVMLAAAEFGVAAVEIGGFLEEHARRLLRADARLTPLTTVVFGSESAATIPRGRRDDDRAMQFSWVDLPSSDAPPFHLGMARFSEPAGEAACWGRDRNPALAYDKAVAELWEREACARPGGLRIARSGEAGEFVEPRNVVAYLPSQYRKRSFPFTPYSEKREYGWKTGIEYATGREISVLAESVYFRSSLPRALRARACTAATTSGVAAHPDREAALRLAVLELVERDAFMAAWLGGPAGAGIAAASLPRAIRKRLAALRDIGYRTAIRDITRAMAPVVLVFAQNVKSAITIVAAHAGFDPEAALDHALMELESLAFLRMQAGRKRTIVPRDVRTPEDHGDLYALRRYFRRADRLAACRETRALSRLGGNAPRRWERLLATLHDGGKRLLCVDLTPAGASIGQAGAPLHVVRALVPGLLPISFGNGAEPLGLPQAISLHPSGKALFPHPFA